MSNATLTATLTFTLVMVLAILASPLVAIYQLGKITINFLKWLISLA